jgi:tRNA(fMet)-specific endonuclease VapC
VGFLIDSSVLIEAERGRIDLASHVRSRSGEQVFVSVITMSEVLFGAHRALDEADRNRRTAVAEALFARFAVLAIDATVARLHARLKAHLAALGTPIGPHDLWLAATCLAHGLTMVTANVREFRRVPGLNVESWVPAGGAG